MHLDDRNREADTPGGKDINRIPLTWHDYRDTELVKAFAELSRRRDVYEAHRARTLWRRWYLYLPLCILAVITNGFYITVAVAAALVVVICVLVADVVLPWIAVRRFNAFALVIRRGEFGHAHMWGDELVWELLTAALQAHNIMLTSLFRDDELNKKITPPLTDLLRETGVGRWRLHMYFNMHLKSEVPYTHEARAALETKVALVAMKISTIHQDHTAQ